MILSCFVCQPHRPHEAESYINKHNTLLKEILTSELTWLHGTPAITKLGNYF